MKKLRFAASLFLVLVMLLTSGCGEKKYVRYRAEFFDTFDTVFTIVGYVQREKDFDEYLSYAHQRLQSLHRQMDRYNDYEGVVNIKTINDNAGVRPVEVSQELFDFLSYSIDWCRKSGGKVNIALGPVLEIWHDYRERYEFAEEGLLPAPVQLEEAHGRTDLSKVVLDAQNSTVYLEEPGMSLDVGALAKGYATELVGRELYEMGFDSFSISGGGNIRTFGTAREKDRDLWSFSVANPDSAQDPEAEPVDFLYLRDLSVVTSGDYQRYYVAEGKRIHHIIDPETLYPAEYYRSVTVICADSGLADLLSTWLYTLPIDQAKQMAQQAGADALWVFPDGSVEYTEGYLAYSRNYGGAVLTAE